MTPAAFVDLSTQANAAAFNRCVVAGGNVVRAKMLWARIRYTGSAWEVVASVGSAEIVSANCVWSTDKLTIALSGFETVPVATVSPTFGDTILPCKAYATSSSNIDVAFYSQTNLGTRVSTQATTMDFQIHVVGV